MFAPDTDTNLSGKEARVLLLCTPAGFERYFDRLAAEYAGLELPEPSGRSRKRASSAAKSRRRRRGEPRLMWVAKTPR